MSLISQNSEFFKLLIPNQNFFNALKTYTGSDSYSIFDFRTIFCAKIDENCYRSYQKAAEGQPIQMSAHIIYFQKAASHSKIWHKIPHKMIHSIVHIIWPLPLSDWHIINKSGWNAWNFTIFWYCSCKSV